jgi:hypothetical protein
MTKEVTVPLPLNILNEDKFMYKPYLTYELSAVKVKK